MRIIATHFLENYRPLADITGSNKESYCFRHGYNFMPFEGEYCPLPFGFQRIQLIRNLLHCESVEWLFWQGVDTMIMNHRISVEEIINPFPEKDFFIAKDINGINADSFIVRRSDWSLKWLDFILSKSEEYKNDCWQEQRVMQHNEGHPDFNSKICILPQNSINSYFYDIYQWPTTTPGHFQSGDFLLHLPGMNLKERLDMFNSDRVKREMVY